MTKISGLIVVVCWITFGVYWLVSAFRVKVTAERQSVWSALAHRVPLGLSYVLLADRYLPHPMNLTLTSRADWAWVTGALICLLGLFVTLWARWILAGNWSSDVTFKRGHELIRTGPYRLVRHPIYTGILTMAFGTAIEIGRLRGWLALPLMAVAFLIKLRQEERLMLRHFPNDYSTYQKEVKALVPFVI